MDVVCFEHDQDYVLRRFQAGEFDFIDSVSEVFETDFFAYIQANEILAELAASYPSPRRKHEVPLWVYVASNLSMRLHGVHSFESYPMIVRAGGMINAFAPRMGRKVDHPDTGLVTLTCEGFNEKNHYDRETPCDKDYVRKLAKDTDPDQLTRWFNGDVARLWKEHEAYDQDGIFIGDASYIFVPDNERYEGSDLILFDENDKPVDHKDYQAMSPQRQSKCKRRRCYKLVTLLHTDRQRRCCLLVAFRVMGGKAHECPVFYELLEEFLQAVGPGVVKRLILDRGFIDGAAIGRCKLEHQIDVLIPVRRNMVIYEDVLGLLKLYGHRWRPYAPPGRDAPDAPGASPKARTAAVPAAVAKREAKRQRTLAERAAATPPPPPDKTVVRSEVADFANLDTWEACPVPLHGVVNRDVYADGHEDVWVLMDTKPLAGRQDAAERRAEYGLRTEIEERYRQLKCFWDLSAFTSTALSLITGQVAFVLLIHNLLQWYLLRRGQAELNRKIPRRLREQLTPTRTVVMIYCDGRCATLSPLAFAALCLGLSEEARPRALAKIRRLQEQLEVERDHPRPP